MIWLISGASHTGKTLLAQRLLEKLHYPYLSMDHLKMGLIRSGNTALTVYEDEQLTELLWPICREMIKTAIENRQNLIVEGCYIPFTWQQDFDVAYRKQIRAVWLIMSRRYIQSHFSEIQHYANAIEKRLDDSGLCMEDLIRENEKNLRQCRLHSCEYYLFDEDYLLPDL